MADDTSGGLLRQLSGRQIGMISLGGTIGTGLFLGSSLAISTAGPAVVLVYLVGALAAVAVAYAVAEMVVVHPDAGGFGAVAARYAGPLTGYVQRWCYWATQVITVGGEVVAAGLYVRYWWPQVPLWSAVCLFSLVILAVNVAAVRLFGEVEYWLAMIKVTALVVFLVLGVLYVVFGLPGRDAVGLSAWTDHGGFAPNGLAGVVLAITVATFSYGGVESVAMTAAESRSPARDIPRAARRVVLRLALFYVLATGIIVAIVPWTEAAAVDGVAESPFVGLFATIGIPAAAGLMNLVILTAALSAANTTLYLASRTAHSLALDGYAPRRLAAVTDRGSPVNAVLASTAGLAVAAVAAALSPDTAFPVLLGIAMFSGMTAWLLIFVAHLAFRRARAGLPPSAVRLPGAPVTAVLSMLYVVLVLAASAFSAAFGPAWQVGVPFVLLVLASYPLVRARRAAREDRAARERRGVEDYTDSV
ncbi:amino acid permease [Saccharothrix yanglingensis]|uniref:amino acid permease n=1 Tax=Saccharothrix yanglingensis TaxID=659496 RepID=UPI0027D2071D|nr:amino acid permease [Saccharothrix yanglingensis]